MTSIIVPAHNENSVIARSLGEWVRGRGSEQIEVVVVCNGCSDNTAEIARRFGPTVHVVESEIANKAHALNLGDQVAHAFPRVYADADIVITREAIEALVKRLERGDILAVAPMPHFDFTGCSWTVRKYYEVRSQLPSAKEGIGGSGVYVLSEQGRRRFAQFPDLIADDLYVRLLFGAKERETLPFATSKVFPPRTLSTLIAIRTRARAGLSQLMRSFPELRAKRGETNHRALLALLREPALWPGLLIYCYVNVFARFRAGIRNFSQNTAWDRDNSSRAAH